MTKSDRSTRREFLEHSGKATAAAAALPYALPHVLGHTPSGHGAFQAGGVRHILPAVTHRRFLIKVSFNDSQNSAPWLAVGHDRTVRGQQTDSDGHFFTFDVDRLAPDHKYTLRLVHKSGRAITSRWPLRTFPAPGSLPKYFRLCCITCPGGRDEFVSPLTNPPTPLFQPLRVKRRLLARALDFAPDALHTNGDHVYRDLRSSPSNIVMGQSLQAGQIAGYFDRNQPVKGTDNEQVLKRAFGPQIADLYGVDWRSVPVYFVIDDHDYADNDEAESDIRTFPPDAWRATLPARPRSSFIRSCSRPATFPRRSQSRTG